MKIIEKHEIEELLNFEDIYNKTIKAFIKFTKGECVVPPFTVFKIKENNGSVHFKTGYISGDKYFAWKYSGAFYDNAKKGLSDFLGVFLIFNAKTGYVEALVNDEGRLTDYRTAVAGAIATNAMAKTHCKTVAVVGTGLQAREQILALSHVKDFEVLNVYGRNKLNVEAYVQDMQKLLPNLKIVGFDDVESAVKDADIIYTTTYSEKPLVKFEWLKKGVHITAMGACEPTMQELDPQILLNADLVVADSIEACSQNGELNHALKISKEVLNKTKELGEILYHEIDRNDSDITVCDLVGIGVQDAAIASSVMDQYAFK